MGDIAPLFSSLLSFLLYLQLRANVESADPPSDNGMGDYQSRMLRFRVKKLMLTETKAIYSRSNSQGN